MGIDIFLNVVGGLVLIFIISIWSKFLKSYERWKERPSAQRERETDAELARRLALSSQRLTGFIGTILLMGMGLTSLVGCVLLTWAIFVVHLIPIYLAFAVGFLASGVLFAWWGIKMLSATADAVRQGERVRLQQVN